MWIARHQGSNGEAESALVFFKQSEGVDDSDWIPWPLAWQMCQANQFVVWRAYKLQTQIIILTLGGDNVAVTWGFDSQQKATRLHTQCRMPRCHSWGRFQFTLRCFALQNNQRGTNTEENNNYLYGHSHFLYRVVDQPHWTRSTFRTTDRPKGGHSSGKCRKIAARDLHLTTLTGVPYKWIAA